MDILIQILSIGSIIWIGILCFKYAPIKFNNKTLVTVGVLILLSYILSRISLMLPLFGYPSLKIGFSTLPLMVIGIMYGPSYAFLAGFIEDILELITGGISYPFFGFMLNKVLIGVICALWFIWYKRNQKEYKIIPYVITIAMSLFTIVYLLDLTEIKVGTDIVLINDVTRYSLIGVLILSSAFILTSMTLIKKKLKELPTLPFSVFMGMLLSTTLLTSVILTPSYLYAMYHIPYILSFFAQLFKSTLLIPIFAYVGYMSVYLVLRISKHTL
jgi:ECF transporter S component (folate family)